MILLAGYFLSIVGAIKNSFAYVLGLALFFSWLGDCFLIFKQDKLFFILGLAAFLVAHIAYIITFYKFKKVISSLTIFSIVAVFVFYTLMLMYMLWPELGEMLVPVILYAIVLTLMGITGVVRNLRVNKLPVIGVMLFVVSDSLIAYTKFVEPLYLGGFIIMSTYIVAQFLIVKGLSERFLKEIEIK